MPTTGTVTISAVTASTLATPENRSGTMLDSINAVYAYADGVAAGQNDLVWSDRITLGAGATTTIDLNGGGLTNVFGAAVNFVEVTSIVIRNLETVAGTRTLRFGPAPANTFLWTFGTPNDGVDIAPKGAYGQYVDAGVASPAGNDSIQIVNTDGANAVVYDIQIIGRSA